MFILRVFSAAAILVLFSYGAVADPARLALIVTNKEYPSSVGPLQNTHRDGERIAVALANLGFSVVHKRDLDKSTMLTEVADYVARLEKAGPDAVGFFYYAGHGAANSKYGENYLIPVAAPISSDTQLPVLGVRLGEIIDSIGATTAKANFLVFDACRDVPIAFSVRGSQHGLRPETHRQGVLVAFATDPGKTATDEGVYAAALSEEIVKPGVLATEVFRSVRSRVLTATADQQLPWVEDGLIENMYFKPPMGAASTPIAVPDVPRADAPRPQTSETAAARQSPNELSLVATLGTVNDQAALGVNLVNWSESWGTALDTGGKKGALVYRTLPGGAADLAGIRPFDLITSFNGIPADNARGVALLVSRQRAGQKVGVQILRFAPSENVFIEQLKKLDRDNNTGATKLLAWIYANAGNDAGKQAEAARIYRRIANAGQTDALTALGTLYAQGKGVPKDPAEAAKLFRKASDLGDVGATYSLATFYFRGDGVAKDLAEALKLYRKAADLGDAGAMSMLGNMYRRGQGVSQGYPEALGFYRRAAGLGQSYAMNELGRMYVKGQGVTRDYAEAARQFKKSSDLGNPHAMNNLGDLHFEGLGVPRNPSEAFRFYERAVALGNFRASKKLAQAYDKGEVVTRNPAKAAELIVTALKAGESRAAQEAPYPDASANFRKELQGLLAKEGVYDGLLDGKPSERLASSVATLAKKNAKPFEADD